MKRLMVPVVLLSLALAAYGQAVNIQQIKPSEIDLSKVDLSKVAFYFNGPIQLYVTGIDYEGTDYSAVLNYTGGDTIEVETPQVVTTEGKPQSVDLSTAKLSVSREGVRLSDVLVDGARYSGVLTVTANNELAVQSLQRGQQVTASAMTLEQLNGQIAQLKQEIQQKDQRIARLNSQLAQTTVEGQVRELRNQVSQLEDQVTQKNARIASLESQVKTIQGESWQTASGRLTRTLRLGFDNGTAAFGSWQASRYSVAQTSAADLYAKFTIPQKQDYGQLLYTFTGRAAGSGWRGFGLHFLASGAATSRGYGYGRSYLVWVTRHEAHYESPKTYVQLYRSYDDVHMVELASMAVDASMATSNDVGVYVNRGDKTITVILNGKRVLSYQDKDLLTGDEVAVRALGTVTVENLRIKTE